MLLKSRSSLKVDSLKVDPKNAVLGATFAELSVHMRIRIHLHLHMHLHLQLYLHLHLTYTYTYTYSNIGMHLHAPASSIHAINLPLSASSP